MFIGVIRKEQFDALLDELAEEFIEMTFKANGNVGPIRVIKPNGDEFYTEEAQSTYQNLVWYFEHTICQFFDIESNAQCDWLEPKPKEPYAPSHL